MTVEARAIFDDVRKRLTAMADDPPFRFMHTPERDAEAYRQRMKTFVGYSEQEVARAEQRLGVVFPTVYRNFLLLMGRHRGELLVGSDVAGLEDFDEFRANAIELMSESGAAEPLPPNAVVFLFHQGYSFAYIIADGMFDSAVHHYTEGDPKASVIAPGFATFLDAELRLAEQVHRQSHEQGGYYLTVDGASVTRTYPALNSGDRPLEKPNP
jgi:SMI1 / KNR4 family (SUKH-1)